MSRFRWPVLVSVVLLLGLENFMTAAPTEVLVGRPHVWTLEQAHYLLAKQRNSNKDLASRAPGPDDLNPNGLNGTRIDVLRSMFGFGLKFDQSIAANNDIVLTNYRQDMQRRDELNTRIDTYGERSVQLAKDISTVKQQIASLNPDKDKETIAQKQSVLEALSGEKGSVDAEMTRLQQQVTSINTQKPNLTTAAGESSAELPGSSIAELVKNGGAVLGSPKLHASTVLDNYVQMQYELIAKQLSLIRDDLGGNQRLVFVELPVTLFTTPGKSDNKIVQVWWHINSYDICVSGCQSEVQEGGTSKWYLPTQQLLSPSYAGSNESNACSRFQDVQQRQFQTGAVRDDAPIEVVDLMPRQSALNVNENRQHSQGLNLNAALNWLSGLGIKTTYERQRETIEQGITSDAFASGFGRGTDSFGWIFSPTPGSNRLAPGLRTTFAAVVVPRDAVAIHLSASACVIDRKSPVAGSWDAATHDSVRCVNFPEVVESFEQEGEGFWVDTARYTPVRTGEMATLTLTGHFSPQVGVLVNGVGLTREVTLAEKVADFATAPATNETRGEFEFVSQSELVLRFRTHASFDRSPRITLITPQKVRDLGPYSVLVNGTCTTLDSAFEETPVFLPTLSLSALHYVELSRNVPPNSPTVTLNLSGGGFRGTDRLLVNGVEVPFTRPSPSVLTFTMPFSAQPKWHVVIQRADGRDAALLSLTNPLLFKQGDAVLTPSGQKTNKQPERFIVTLSVAEGAFDASLDTVEVKGAKQVGTARFSASSAIVEVQELDADFTIVVSRAGTPFAQAWSLQKPKASKSGG